MDGNLIHGLDVRWHVRVPLGQATLVAHMNRKDSQYHGMLLGRGYKAEYWYKETLLIR